MKASARDATGPRRANFRGRNRHGRQRRPNLSPMRSALRSGHSAAASSLAAILCPLVALANFCLLMPAGAAAGSNPTPERAIQMLNEWRAAVGVAPVSHDPTQSEGCRLHASYYGLTGHTGHKEEPSSPGYTEAGNKAAASSVLTYGGGADGPYAWENAVYHRTSLLDPKLATSGFWAEHGLGCMGVFGEDENRRTTELAIYPYPYNEQRGVATTFTCNEMPNPCESVPGNDGEQPTGFIPSVQFNGPWESIYGPLVSTAELVPDGGAAVALTVEDDDSGLGSYLDGGFDLIPHQPLAAGTWYTASATGVLRTYTSSEAGEETPVPFSVSWRFLTKVAQQASKLNLSLPGGRPIVTSRNPNPVELTLREGHKTRRLSLALSPAGNRLHRAVLPRRIRTASWEACATQAADAAWQSDRDCERGAPIRLRVEVLYADARFVRVRIKAPAAARGRLATVTMRARGGAVLDRTRVSLRQQARFDLHGARDLRSTLSVTVHPFVKDGLPRVVRPVAKRLR
jgi:cysteine-rich secretory family protein